MAILRSNPLWALRLKTTKFLLFWLATTRKSPLRFKAKLRGQAPH
jgi:hypothetical protein